MRAIVWEGDGFGSSHMACVMALSARRSTCQLANRPLSLSPWMFPGAPLPGWRKTIMS